MTPGKMLLAFLILATTFAFAFPEAAIKPGGLSNGHSEIAQKCSSCHESFRGATQQKCISCHKIGDIGRVTTGGRPLLAADANRKVLFHAGLAKKDCVTCHAMHRSGRYGNSGAKFDHDLLATSVKSDCASCHDRQRPTDGLHQKANNRCAGCHGTAGWHPSTLDHDAYFRFDSNHPSRCDTCHLDPSAYSTYSCYGCHAHTPAGMVAAHAEEGIRNLDRCVRYHRTGTAEGSEGGERE